MTDLDALRAANTRRWDHARTTRDFEPVAGRLVAAKARYEVVSAATGVPWAMVAVVHERESSQDWTRSLAQGDPWDRVSVHEPRGRGPFASWEEAAIDALVNCGPRVARNKDWSIGSTLTELEEYNGLGYAARGEPSPYIWSGTDQYVCGKYIHDGVYDPHAIDSQPGCAGLLMAMMRLDPTIAFAGATPRLVPSDAAPLPPQEPSRPSITNPSKGSLGAFVKNLIRAIFRRK